MALGQAGDRYRGKVQAWAPYATVVKNLNTWSSLKYDEWVTETSAKIIKRVSQLNQLIH